MNFCNDCTSQYCSNAAKAINSGANNPMSNHPIRLVSACPPRICVTLCFHPTFLTTPSPSPRFGFHHAVYGRSSSGQTPGRLRWTIFHVHSASVTKHVDKMPKVPRWVGWGSQTRLVVMLDEMLPAAPASTSHMVVFVCPCSYTLRAVFLPEGVGGWLFSIVVVFDIKGGVKMIMYE